MSRGTLLLYAHPPTTLLSPSSLRAVVGAIVAQDGTDHSFVELRIELVLRQLDLGSLELHFEQATALSEKSAFTDYDLRATADFSESADKKPRLALVLLQAPKPWLRTNT